MSVTLDAGLLDYEPTVKQAQYLKTYLELDDPTWSAVADVHGVDQSTVRRVLTKLAKKAALKGYAPGHFTAGTAPSFMAGKITVHRNAANEIIQTWERQHPVLDADSIKDAVASFMEDHEPFKDKKPLRKNYNTDIVPWIQIGDAHFGMLAHAAETGQNFDLKIAEAELCGAISMLIDEAEPSERCVINDLGDFTHYENFAGVTEASGHLLDFDTRFPRMIKVYSRTMRFIIDCALKKFKFVDVIINQGNHSRTNDVWMAELIRVAYERTDRVNVLDNDSVYITYRMGNTFVLTHHSDKCKPAKLAHVMATDFAQDWGESKFRYIDIGHIHHAMVLKEHPGVVVESWNILAAPDKYAHDGGWRSRQAVTMVYRSRTYGDIGRRHLPVLQIRDRIYSNLDDSPQKERRAHAV